MTADDRSKPSSDTSETQPETVWRHPLGMKVIRFDDLSRCGAEVWIEHEGQLYRLRKTRHGKLVLTK
ncbi:hemin uptake protein HemP [Stieleria sp. TO1_6]|uniref:hemin uptake protein HemP n=1 Tax=Stieleria tagensis TaxID=2956795 RepID=UPI00209AA7E7|nr:hemin uptake protein HemP [Stieleria tagensis]MCO8124153.1 hemin uptake protein HemP [Stieleria tagensis]